MPTPFPGMDPYLERPSLWRGVHTQLIVGLGQAITQKVRPRYSVSIEERTYIATHADDEETGIPDVMVMRNRSDNLIPATGFVTLEATTTVAPVLAELPMPEKVIERYLEISEVKSRKIVTAIEILSPTNKSSTEGRREYQQKRSKVLGSQTHLIEIDLLRAGRPMAMQVSEKKGSDYRIVISRTEKRPHADLYLFSVRQAIPAIPIPLLCNDPEPLIDLNQIVHNLYDALGYDMKVDYTEEAIPPLRGSDAVWGDQLLRQHYLRGENGAV